MTTFRTSPGMRDLLGDDAARRRAFDSAFVTVVGAAGYEQIVPPILEDIGVFSRIGEATDVVSKEMYDFVDRGGRHVALRPEQTASVCRAFVEHRPSLPYKAWYSGPNFRYEKPQRGRQRQFDQVGVEVLGTDDPYADVEVIAIGWDFLTSLGLADVDLVLNSLGDPEDRRRFSEAVGEHLRAHVGGLSEQSRETLERNPLRVLDSKRAEDAPIIAGAPRIEEFWSPEAAEHFAAVRDGLDRIGVPWRLDGGLVRGLDYYRRTTFEFRSGALDSAQNALGGGGRYDGLVEDLGGPATPGIGFAIGVERTLIACDVESVFPGPAGGVEVFVVDTTGGSEALALSTELRRAGRSVDRGFGGRSMKAQMKAADRSGAELALIIGEDEAASDTVTARFLRGVRPQEQWPRAETAARVAAALAENEPPEMTES
ncbi:MAG: histidine--tRNA ligase [Ilumatobacteraceae bacterium]|nr:histidine--tRNA ligase [Ilumatobacteraceae bacterium]MBL6759331.1 histidine--tRNA ligase [Ilumatobacteraceae bacterium]